MLKLLLVPEVSDLSKHSGFQSVARGGCLDVPFCTGTPVGVAYDTSACCFADSMPFFSCFEELGSQ